MEYKIIEITRSYTRKKNLGNFENQDVFCSATVTTDEKFKELVSQELFKFCKQEVEKDLETDEERQLKVEKEKQIKRNARSADKREKLEKNAFDARDVVDFGETNI